jgi:hypothetical protein
LGTDRADAAARSEHAGGGERCAAAGGDRCSGGDRRRTGQGGRAGLAQQRLVRASVRHDR